MPIARPSPEGSLGPIPGPKRTDDGIARSIIAHWRLAANSTVVPLQGRTYLSTPWSQRCRRLCGRLAIPDGSGRSLCIPQGAWKGYGFQFVFDLLYDLAERVEETAAGFSDPEVQPRSVP
jgi:hypothetical protein